MSQLFFKFPLKYIIRKVKENQKGFKSKGIHRFLVNADCVRELHKNINVIKRKTEALLVTREDVGLNAIEKEESLSSYLVTQTQEKKLRHEDI